MMCLSITPKIFYLVPWKCCDPLFYTVNFLKDTTQKVAWHEIVIVSNLLPWGELLSVDVCLFSWLLEEPDGVFKLAT